MGSRDIIIKLLNEHLITGEEAFVLINDVLQSEMLEAWKALNNKSTLDIGDDNKWIKYCSYPSITTNTCASTLTASSGYGIASSASSI